MIAPENTAVKQGWKELMCGETSCYWYWDGTEEWDSKPATAANLAVNAVKDVIASGEDKMGPSIYHPQREPYNPGGTEWGVAMSSDFTVWTYVYDLSGLKSVKLMYRVDKDGKNPITSNQNETYAGGDEVGAWQEVAMTSREIESITNPKPVCKADEYSAKIEGLKDALVDYYVEAVDNKGNVSRSQILHVYVGKVSGGGGGSNDPVYNLGNYAINPEHPSTSDVITITAKNGSEGMVLHWGVNDYEKPIQEYMPEGSKYHTDGKAARTPFVKNAEGQYECKIGPFNNAAQKVSYISFVTETNGSWDNNSGQNYKFTVLDPTGVDAVQDVELGFHAYALNGGIVVRLPRQDMNCEVAVYNLAGMAVWSGSMHSSMPAVPVELAKGVYLVRCLDPVSGRVSTAKVAL